MRDKFESKTKNNQDDLEFVDDATLKDLTISLALQSIYYFSNKYVQYA